MKRQPVYFISHGGGPWPYIPDMKAMFTQSVKWFSHLSETWVEKPKAILMVTAHWEEKEFTVSAAAHPPMIYDYSGFPEHTYKIKYPAPGSPEIANMVKELLDAKNIPCQVDPARGFDHGTFVPLSLICPKADMPIVSFSIKENYSPAEHIKVGHALESLRDQGVMIMGSGLSYHNLRAFGNNQGKTVSIEFEKWLTETVEEKNSETRNKRLLAWETAPMARLAHPQEDHLLPLMVVSGAAGKDLGKKAFADEAMNVIMASYQFGL